MLNRKLVLLGSEPPLSMRFESSTVSKKKHVASSERKMNEFSLINLEVNISVSQKNGDKLHLSWVEWVFVKTLRKHVKF